MTSGCLLCGANDALGLVYQIAEYEIVRCSQCALTQLGDRPEAQEVRALYEQGYFHGDEGGVGYANYASQEEEYLRTFREDIKAIQRWVSGGTVLDVGCGFGFFLQAALEAGFEAYGVDLSPDAVAKASERSPGRVFQGVVDEVEELKGKTFDVVFASHVVEHIVDVGAFVGDLAKRLAPGGILVMVTPNIESLLARVSGPRWVSFKLPEHVAYYCPSTMARLVEGAGLQVKTTDSAYQHYSLPFVAQKVRALFSPVSKLVPPVEKLPGLRNQVVRVTSGSLRVVASAPTTG